eukprot:2251638-Rhodomonas_salina.1
MHLCQLQGRIETATKAGVETRARHIRSNPEGASNTPTTRRTFFSGASALFFGAMPRSKADGTCLELGESAYCKDLGGCCTVHLYGHDVFCTLGTGLLPVVTLQAQIEIKAARVEASPSGRIIARGYSSMNMENFNPQAQLIGASWQEMALRCAGMRPEHMPLPLAHIHANVGPPLPMHANAGHHPALMNMTVLQAIPQTPQTMPRMMAMIPQQVRLLLPVDCSDAAICGCGADIPAVSTESHVATDTPSFVLRSDSCFRSPEQRQIQAW